MAELTAAVSASPFVNAPAALATSKTAIDVLVSPQFLASASLFITELVSVVAVVVFTCCKAMPKRKAKKADKGKGKGAAGGGADPDDAAIDGVRRAFAEALHSLEFCTELLMCTARFSCRHSRR